VQAHLVESRDRGVDERAMALARELCFGVQF
jgi:hypothetical protein